MQPLGDFGVRNLLGTATTLACMAMAACSNNKEYYVIAATGTVIGVEVSQNPATQTPQAKLGYNRGELAIVPSNRPACLSNGNQTAATCAQLGGGGAKDVPDVLMEIRYGGIFDLGASSGIYQRLAVGETAVRQPGATLLFARNADGAVDTAAAAAIMAAQESASKIVVLRTTAIDQIMADVESEDGTLAKNKLQALLDATPTAEHVEGFIMEAQDPDDLRTRLVDVPLSILQAIAANIGAS